MAYFGFLQNMFAKKRDEAAGGEAEPPKLPGLTVGRAMKIVLEPENGEGADLPLSTSFDGFDTNGFLIVNAPVFKGAVYPIPDGGIYPVTYRVHRDNYRMKCRVAKAYSENKLHFLLLERVSEVEKIERRGDYRLPVKFPCGLTRFPVSAEGAPAPIEFPATMLDLSAGGAKLEIPVLLAHGEEIDCVVVIGEYGEMEFSLVVRWVEPILDSLDPSFRVGLQFVRLTNSDENILMRYIFNEQLIRRRARRSS